MRRALTIPLTIGTLLTACDRGAQGEGQKAGNVSQADLLARGDSVSWVRAAIQAVDPTGHDSLRVLDYVKDSSGVTINLLPGLHLPPDMVMVGGGGRVRIDRPGTLRVVMLFK